MERIVSQLNKLARHALPPTVKAGEKDFVKDALNAGELQLVGTHESSGPGYSTRIRKTDYIILPQFWTALIQPGCSVKLLYLDRKSNTWTSTAKLHKEKEEKLKEKEGELLMKGLTLDLMKSCLDIKEKILNMTKEKPVNPYLGKKGVLLVVVLFIAMRWVSRRWRSHREGC
ncbi:hypothetical protein K469DRAFT_210623 [Zopfia rhizophila CBS 207.26]|uniref:Uncharacterized protein n=1 Tax=Zopfia rhizophila CBS 207.26 TaxID=1314779 RepID=A0A6A6DYH6_9PEZI|nr:hypothetical protein K469DRAFT_210623 [Zopfia rhizophila CBS 207.26]